jgi:hypothetical protein
MTLSAIDRCIGASINSLQPEPTLSEILSGSIFVALMKADGVNPVTLEAQLRRITQSASAGLKHEVPTVIDPMTAYS